MNTCPSKRSRPPPLSEQIRFFSLSGDSTGKQGSHSLPCFSSCSIRSARARSGRSHGRISSYPGLLKSGACCHSPARRPSIGSPSFPLSRLAYNAHFPWSGTPPKGRAGTARRLAPPWRDTSPFPEKRQGVLMDLGLKVILICAAFMLLSTVLGLIGKKLAD